MAQVRLAGYGQFLTYLLWRKCGPRRNANSIPTMAQVRLAGYGWAANVYYDNDAMDRRAHQPEWMAVS